MAKHDKNEKLGEETITKTKGKWLGIHGGGPIDKAAQAKRKREPDMPKNLKARVQHFDQKLQGQKGYTRPGSNKK